MFAVVVPVAVALGPQLAGCRPSVRSDSRSRPHIFPVQYFRLEVAEVVTAVLTLSNRASRIHFSALPWI